MSSYSLSRCTRSRTRRIKSISRRFWLIFEAIRRYIRRQGCVMALGMMRRRLFYTHISFDPRGYRSLFSFFFLLLSCLSCTFAFCLFFLCCLILRRLGYTSLLLDQYVYRVRSTEYTTTTIDPTRDITKNSPNSFCCQGPTRNRTPFSPRAQPNIHPPNNSLTFRVILSRLPAGRSARSASAYAYANEPCKPWLMADTRFALYRTSLDVCHWVLVIEAG